LRLPRSPRGLDCTRPQVPHALRHRTPPASVGRLRRIHAPAPPRPIRLRPLGRKTPSPHLAPRPLRHLPTLLVPQKNREGRFLAFRIGNQIPPCVGSHPGETGSARHQSRLHVLRTAGAAHLFRGNQLPPPRSLPHNRFCRGNHKGPCLLGNRLP